MRYLALAGKEAVVFLVAAKAVVEDDSGGSGGELLRAEEEEEEEARMLMFAVTLITFLSSSFMVSKILGNLCLVTLIYCGGATSLTNLAIIEFAIIIYIKVYVLMWFNLYERKRERKKI